MKLPSFFCWAIVIACAAGCQTRPGATAPPAAAPALLVPVASRCDAPAQGYPPEYEEYYVGRIPDPEDPRFSYQPGILRVERRPARPRLGGDEVQVAPAFHRGPVTTARLADDHPEPTREELAALALRAQRLARALNDDNDRLRAELAGVARPPPPATPVGAVDTNSDDDATPVQPAPPVTASPTAPVPASATPPADSPAAPEMPAELNVVRPNTDNVIELDPALLAAPAAGNNPFVQVYQPAVHLREITLVVSAAVPGPTPTAVLNDTLYPLHSQFQGLEVWRVDADTVYLRRDPFLLACPVSEKPLRLRVP